MKKLAIKGHPTRGKEVIVLLEMLGGRNVEGFIGTDFDELYTIEDNCIIQAYDWNNCVCFTLEEFLKKYPYKVGDKVHIPEYESEVDICGMRWDSLCNYMEYMVYRNNDEEWYTAEELLEYNDNFLEDKHCNEKQVNGMKNILAELLDHIKNTSKEELEKEFNELEEWSNVGPTVEEFMDFCNKVNKKPKYPTTYEECCQHLGCDDKLCVGKLIPFQQLINARNAYWKIYGEEMGLSKSWEPEYVTLKDNTYFIIQTFNGEIDKSATSHRNAILAFPTIEMRDTFYENFKVLIEECKELL